MQISNVTAEHYRQLDEAKARASAEVQAKAEAAKAEINGFNVTDYVKDDAKSNIDKAVTEAKAAIASATSKDLINDAKDEAFSKIKIEVEKIRIDTKPGTRWYTN